MVLRGNVFCIFSVIWGLERLSLTLFNLCVASFLTSVAQSTKISVVGTIYLVIQTLPLVLLSLYMGIWLDNSQRSKVVPRILLVKLIALILTLSFSSLILLFNVTIGLFLMIPVLIVIIAISAVTNCMHLALHLATERIWVVVAAQGDSNSSRFLIRCNSAMSIAQDIGQVLGLIGFESMALDWDSDVVFLVCGVVVIFTSSIQLFSYKLVDHMCMPPEVNSVSGQKRTLKAGLVEFVSQRDTPVGVCWASRSTFTAVWFAATVMEHSPMSVLCKWFYFVSTISASISYMVSAPKMRSHVILTVVAAAEVVAIVMASTPLLVSRLQVAGAGNKSTLLEVAEHTVQHTAIVSLNELAPKVYTVATHVLLALAVVLGAACNRTWNLTALQVFQESVPARSRGTVGGVQYLLNYTALSLHGLLALSARGKEYVWGCALIGVFLSIFNLVVLVWWRRIKLTGSETVTLLTRDFTVQLTDSNTSQML